MGWGAWMVPEISLMTQANMRAYELEIRQTVHKEPNAVAELAVKLAWQSAAYDAIVRQATRHIAELEAKQALLDYEMEKAKAQQRPKWWIFRWWV